MPSVHESCATYNSVIRVFWDSGEQKAWMMQMAFIQALILSEQAACALFALSIGGKQRV